MASGARAEPSTLAALRASIRWGEPSIAVTAKFRAKATVLPRPLDFGDAYAGIALRDVPVGGVGTIAYFEFDKRTGGLKRILLELPRHRVNPPAARAVLRGIAAEYGVPAASCSNGAAPERGYQASAEWLWQRGGTAIRAVFRDSTIEASEGCLSGDLPAGPCGLTGQFLIRISPRRGAGSGCAANVAAAPR